MANYTPDCWVVLRFTSDQYGVIDKVLAGWAGGYTQGSSWKLNSGNEKVEDMGDYYLVTGSSGSTYTLDKGRHGLRLSIAGVYDSIVKNMAECGATVELLDGVE